MNLEEIENKLKELRKYGYWDNYGFNIMFELVEVLIEDKLSTLSQKDVKKWIKEKRGLKNENKTRSR